MEDDKVYKAVKKQWKEVVELPTQTMGPLTPLYKRLVPLFKVYPWRVLIIASFIAAVFAYIILGPFLVKAVSILQKGF